MPLRLSMTWMLIFVEKRNPYPRKRSREMTRYITFWKGSQCPPLQIWVWKGERRQQRNYSTGTRTHPATRLTGLDLRISSCPNFLLSLILKCPPPFHHLLFILSSNNKSSAIAFRAYRLKGKGGRFDWKRSVQQRLRKNLKPQISIELHFLCRMKIKENLETYFSSFNHLFVHSYIRSFIR